MGSWISYMLKNLKYLDLTFSLQIPLTHFIGIITWQAKMIRGRRVVDRSQRKA